METWKIIEDFNLYEISDLGNVRRIGSIKNLKLCRGVGKGRQYYYVNLCIDGKAKSKKVHRLVAAAFIPNPLNKKTVNHKDGNKFNNAVSNLEWNSIEENIEHAIKSGLNLGSHLNYK